MPDPAAIVDENERVAAEKALAYMGLEAGTPLREVAVDTVFVGSCTNGRIEDLRAAAAVIKGRKVADGVRMLVVPGSMRVRFQAEDEGLDEVFRAAGAEWRSAGCSMCLGMNPDQLAPGERSASTSNRNFEGRQGKGGRTHLVSPLVAAATAVRGTLSLPGGPGLMEPFSTHTGIGVPLRRSNVDTDQIIPAVYLKRVTRTGFEDGLFSAWRQHAGLHPQHRAVLPRVGAGGRAGLRHGLLARARRLGAAWTTASGSSSRPGSATSSAATPPRRGCSPRRWRSRTSSCCGSCWRTTPAPRSPSTSTEKTVQARDLTVRFEIDDYTRWRLLEGLDDIGLTLRHADDIAVFEAARPARMPSTSGA